jgi:hypothetical protein
LIVVISVFESVRITDTLSSPGLTDHTNLLSDDNAIGLEYVECLKVIEHVESVSAEKMLTAVTPNSTATARKAQNDLARRARKRDPGLLNLFTIITSFEDSDLRGLTAVIDYGFPGVLGERLSFGKGFSCLHGIESTYR